MYFQVMNRNGTLYLVPEAQLDVFIAMGWAFFLSPGK